MKGTCIDRWLALFMACLIIFIPINFSVMVSAQNNGPSSPSYTPSLSVVSVYGNDNIDGFRRADDQTSVRVQASLGTNTTLSGQNLEVYLGGFAQGTFNSCNLVSPSSSTYECTYTQPANQGAIFAGSNTIEIRLVQGFSVLGSSVTAIEVDTQAPRANSFTLSSTRTNNPDQTASFSVKDYSFGNRPGVGLQYVSLSGPDGEIYSWNYNDTVQNPPTSLTKGSIPFTLPDESGDYEICLRMTDTFDQESVECQTIVYDTEAPELFQSGFKLQRQDGESISWFDDRPVNFIVFVQLETTDVDVSTIRGNFSDLNPSAIQVNYDECNTVDANGNDVLECKFPLTSARINESRGYKFSFSAEDSLGNKATITTSQQLEYDTDSPSYQFLDGVANYPLYFNDRFFVGNEPFSVFANYEELGVGLNDAQVFLDAGQLGLSRKIQADNCTVSGSRGWDCHFPELQVQTVQSNLPRSVRTIQNAYGVDEDITIPAYDAFFLLPTPEDDLGNKGETARYNVSIDIEPPTILSEKVSIIPASGDFLRDDKNFTVNNDFIQIEYNVSDAVGVTMEIFAGQFVDYPEGVDRSTVYCDDYEFYHYCSFTLGPIQTEGYLNEVLKVNFNDYLGNNLTDHETPPIEVFEVLNATGDYWGAPTVDCSPNPLDRQLVDRLPSTVYCRVQLNTLPDQEGVEIFDVRGGDCSILEQSNLVNQTDIMFNSYQFLGLQRRERDVVISYELAAFNPIINNFTTNCELFVRSEVTEGNSIGITEDFEAINITSTIGFYNNPTSDIVTGVATEVEEKYEKYIEGMEFIGMLAAFVDLSRALCGVVHIISTIGTLLIITGHVMSFPSDGLKITGAALAATPGGQGAGAALIGAGTSMGGSSTGMMAAGGANLDMVAVVYSFARMYCDFITCRLIMGDAHEAILQAYSTYVRLAFVNEMQVMRGLGEVAGKTIRGGASGTSIPETSQSSTQNSAGATNSGASLAVDFINFVPSAYAQSSTSSATAPADTGGGNSFSNPFRGGVRTSDGSTPVESDINSAIFGSPNIDPHSNFITAIATLCVPALISHFENYRQIECQHGLCLIESSQNGLPVHNCAEIKNEAICRFIFGPVASLIPFANLIDLIQELWIAILTNPIIIVEFVAKYLVCKPVLAGTFLCSAPAPPTCSQNAVLFLGCALSATADIVSEIITYVSTIDDQNWSFEFGGEHGPYCGPFASSYDEFKQQQEALGQQYGAQQPAQQEVQVNP